MERTRARGEEEESVFVTMTDMTISFLLIIMILLAFVATQINDDETVPLTAYERVREERDDLRGKNQDLHASLKTLDDKLARVLTELSTVTTERDRLHAEIEKLQVINPIEAYLSQGIAQRREILVKLRDRLLVKFPKLEVVINPEQDALRFQGEGLFRSGSSELERRQREIVETLGRLLNEILVCFTLGERSERGPDCRSGHALIETVQIEGHTDGFGDFIDNLRLSTERANVSLIAMFDEERSILAHQNLRGEPVMSVSGYGQMRPIETNDTTEGKAANRRIDLRIIMYAPTTIEEVKEVGRRLDALRAAKVSK